MTIRIFVDKLILCFLLLGGVSKIVADRDGYVYSRPAIGFSEGVSNIGVASQASYQPKQPEYVVASSTSRPASVYSSTVKSQASATKGFDKQSTGQFSGQAGQYSGVEQYKTPIVTKPQTSYDSAQTFGKSQSVGISRPDSTQYGQSQTQQKFQAPTVSTTIRPKTSFGALQGFEQSSSKVAAPQTQRYQGSTVTATAKPQKSYGGSEELGQSVLKVGNPSVTQYQSSQYKAPTILVTAKPRQSSGSSQTTYDQGGQKKVQSVSVVSNPQQNVGGFQYPASYSESIQTSQYQGQQNKSPSVPKPQASFGTLQGLGQQFGSSQTTKQPGGQYRTSPVAVAVKPQTSFGAFQGLGQSSGSSQTIQQQGGQYKTPSVAVTNKPQTSFGSFQSDEKSSGSSRTTQYQNGQKKLQSVTVVSRPQTSFGAFQSPGQSSGFTQTIQSQGQQYKSPSVSKTQTSFGTFQGLGRPSGSSQATQQQGTQYKKPLLAVTVKPKPSFDAFRGSGSSQTNQYQNGQNRVQSVTVVSKPQTSFGAFPGYGQSSGSSQTNQYQNEKSKGQSVTVVSKPQTSFSSFQGSGSSQTIQHQGGQYKTPSVEVTYKPQTSFGAVQERGQSSGSSQTTPYHSGQNKVQSVSVVSKPEIIFGAFKSPVQSSGPSQTAQQQGGQYKASSVAVTIKPQTSFGAFQSYGKSPGSSQATQYQHGQNNVQSVSVVSKPQTNFGSFQSPGLSSGSFQTTQYQSHQFQSPSVPKPQTSSSTYQGLGQLSGSSQTTQNQAGQYKTPSLAVTVKPQTTFDAFQGSRQSSGSSQTNQYQNGQNKVQSAVVISKPQSSISAFRESKYSQSAQIQGGQYKTPSVAVVAKSPNNFGTGQEHAPSKSSSSPAVQRQGSTVLTTAKPSLAYSSSPSDQHQQSAHYQESLVSSTVRPSETNQQPSASTEVQQKQSFQSYGQTNSFKKPDSQSLSGFEQTTDSYISELTPKTVEFAYLAPTKPQAPEIKIEPKPTPKPIVPQYPSVVKSVKPDLSYLPPQTQHLSSSTDPKPVSITASPVRKYDDQSYARPPAATQYQASGSVTQKPQSSFNAFQSLSQTNTQKPIKLNEQPLKSAVISQGGHYQTVPYQQVPTGLSQNPLAPQPIFQRVTTPKPLIITAKPQNTFVQSQKASSFSQLEQPSNKPQQVFKQPSFPKPSTFDQSATSGQNQQQNVFTTPKALVTYVSTPPTPFKQPTVQYQKPLVSSTTKPQTNFGAFQGFAQTAYQKPFVSSAISQSYSSSSTAASPQGSNLQSKSQVQLTSVLQPRPQPQSVTSTSITTRPFTPTTKDQGKFGKQIEQKPAFNSLSQSEKPLITSTNKPSTSYESTSAPQKAFNVKVQPQLPLDSLKYLPPAGAKAPIGAEYSSGSGQVISSSKRFFEYPSATANQVVDEAFEQNVGGVVKTSQSGQAFQASSTYAQEPTVENIHLSADRLTASNDRHVQQYLGNPPETSELEIILLNNADNTENTISNQDESSKVYSNNVGSSIRSQSFGGVQPSLNPGVSSPQVVRSQLTTSGIVKDPNQPGQKIFSVSSSPGVNQHESANHEATADSSRLVVVDEQIEDDSPIQDPQPLNSEELLIRQIKEYSSNDFRNLQPGSSLGPHFNKGSDQEYNVFDYDQYSKDPEEEQQEEEKQEEESEDNF